MWLTIILIIRISLRFKILLWTTIIGLFSVLVTLSTYPWSILGLRKNHSHHKNNLSCILWNLIVRHISHQPNSLAITNHHTTPTILITWHFWDPIYHIILEVINVHKWWDPHVFQGSYVISTLEYEENPKKHCEHHKT